MTPVRDVMTEIATATRDVLRSGTAFQKAEQAINYLGDQGLISLRQQRHLLLAAADQAVNEVRDAHDAISKHTAEWEYQYGDPSFAEFDRAETDTFEVTDKYAAARGAVAD